MIAYQLPGIVLRVLGNAERDAGANEETLELTRAAFGPDHEHTLVTANGYAVYLRIGGAFAEALELGHPLLQQHKMVFSEHEEDMLRSVHNLGSGLRVGREVRGSVRAD